MDQEKDQMKSTCFLFLSGTVVHGFGRGSKELNCPTANLDPLMVERIQTSENPLLFGHSGSGIFFGFAQLVRRKDEESKTENDDSKSGERRNDEKSVSNSNHDDDAIIQSIGSQNDSMSEEGRNEEGRSEEGRNEGFNMSVFPASASFGFNPCYNNDSKSLEVHLIHNEEIPDFYGSRLKVVLLGKLREESKFDSLQELIRQIEQDKRETMERIEGMDKVQKDQIISKLKDSSNDSDFVFSFFSSS